MWGSNAKWKILCLNDMNKISLSEIQCKAEELYTVSRFVHLLSGVSGLVIMRKQAMAPSCVWYILTD